MNNPYDPYNSCNTNNTNNNNNNHKTNKIYNNIYVNLVNDIRNNKILTAENIDFIESLSNDKKMEIILFNQNMIGWVVLIKDNSNILTKKPDTYQLTS